MTSKSFKERVQEEVRHFPDIYTAFLEDLEARSREGLVDGNWHHLFGVPFNGVELVEQPSDEAKRELKATHKHDVVLKAIRELGVHELRLGALQIKDQRISTALDMGLLTPDEVVPPSEKHPGELERLANRLKPNNDDPIFWRSLLEILCRAFVSTQGPPPWSLARTIDLAFDLDEIRRALPEGVWNAKEVRRHLREKEPYRTKYGRTDSAAGAAGVGEDRIRSITSLIGPMDSDALFRLKRLFPDEFFKVSDLRLRRKVSENDGPDGALDRAEDLSDALGRASPEPSDG